MAAARFGLNFLVRVVPLVRTSTSATRAPAPIVSLFSRRLGSLANDRLTVVHDSSRNPPLPPRTFANPEVSSKMDGILQKIGVKPFTDETLLPLVLTPIKEHNLQNCGRLNVLGEDVLRVFVGQVLYALYPNLPINVFKVLQLHFSGTQHLSVCADQIGLLPLLNSAGSAPENGAKTFRAFVAAVYLDQGASASLNLIRKVVIGEDLSEAGFARRVRLLFPRTVLNTWLSETAMDPLSVKLEKVADGFQVSVLSGDKLLASGTAPRVRIAEKLALQEALRVRFDSRLDLPLEFEEASTFSFEEPTDFEELHPDEQNE